VQLHTDRSPSDRQQLKDHTPRARGRLDHEALDLLSRQLVDGQLKVASKRATLAMGSLRQVFDVAIIL
jgi:hypothetical protein